MPSHKVLRALCLCDVLVLLLVSALASPRHATFNRRGERLTTVDWEAYNEREHEGPGTYAFGYDVQHKDNVQFREESRDAKGTVRGSYGLIEPDGNIRVVHYIADERGFRVEIENTLKPDQHFPASFRSQFPLSNPR